MTMPQKTYDVAVLGWWYGKNYGSILTYYGLNRAIDSLGHSVLMVHEPLGYNGFRVKWPEDILSMDFARRIGYEYTEQMQYTELSKLNDVARTFVVGSDQLWNPLIGRVNDDLFLDFVAEKNSRVAYGTSFGNAGSAKFKPEFISKHAPNLQKFKAISVREGYAGDTARNVFGVSSTLVVDPVFLMPKEHYSDLADKSTVSTDGDYMAVFFLDPTEEKKTVALGIAEKLGFKKVLVIPNPDEGRDGVTTLFADKPNVEIMAVDAPENFLRAYRDAGYVVTDSFHGTAFSVIFEKPFSSIYNAKRGADRFKNLLGSLGFEDTRRVRETDNEQSLAANPHVTREIDFTNAREYIKSGRASSLEWLKQALDPAQKGSAAIDPPHSIDLRNPEFTAGTAAWRIVRRKNSTQLYVAAGQAKVGNPVWTDLPDSLAPGATYKLEIDWTPRTSNDVVNLHLRNPKSGKFRVIGAIDMKEKRYGSRVDTIYFTATDAAQTQVMIGAVHFPGRRAGAEIRRIKLDRIPAGAVPKAPAGKAGVPAKRADSKNMAVPPVTRTREEIVLSVINDPQVQQLRDRILETDPEISIYVGRELKEYTHNKVGGPADLLAFPKSADQMQTLIQFAIENEVPYTILGRGSNVLVRDGGIRGLVIITTGLAYFRLDGDRFTAGAGASFIEASYFLLEHGRSTIEWASGIPGTVGGAVFMNAGTNVSDIRATIESVKFIDGRGNVRTLQKHEISWGKRHTTFQEHRKWIILEATFITTAASKNELSKKMLATVQVRENHFPLESPNHGSTFKWWRAPRLIMQAGLTGHQIGGAQISKKQPGFFVNVNQATASDYEALINYTIAKVYEYSGFLMEPEVEIIGEYPHRYERYTTASPVTDLERKATGPQA